MNPRWHAFILVAVAAIGLIALLWMKIAAAEERAIAFECDKV